MTVRKLSVAIDEGIAASASRAAETAGVSLSAWLSRAAEHELALERGLAAVRAWEASHGGLSGDELRAADATLDALLARARATRPARRRPKRSARKA